MRRVFERVCQLIGLDVTFAEDTRLVQFKYCGEPERFESLIDLGILLDVTSYDALHDKFHCNYFEGKAQENCHVVIIIRLEKLADNKLKIEMRDSSARSCMESLFVSFWFSLHQHGQSLVTSDNKMIAVTHVLPAIWPKSLCKLL